MKQTIKHTLWSQFHRPRLIHQNYTATILTILIVSSMPAALLSYYNSGLEANIRSTYNFAYAAEKSQIDNGDGQGGSFESSDIALLSRPGIQNLQQKVRELIVEANNANNRAAKAMNAAGNATEQANSLSSIADEADREVKHLFKSVGDEEKGKHNGNETTDAQGQNSIYNNNNYDSEELNSILSEAKQKRKAANLAEEHAKDLSDKANSLNEAAKKAEKLAIAAQKDLEQAIRDSGNSDRSVEEQEGRGQELTKGSNNRVISDEAEDNTLGTRQDQLPLGNTVNDSGSRIQDQFRERSQERIPVLDLSPLINRTSQLGEINKQRSGNNITSSDNEASNNLADMNPFSNSADFNIALPSSNANDTLEFEGIVECKVSSTDNATTSTNTDGENGGCNPQTSMSDRYQYNVWSEGDEDNRFILFKRSVKDRPSEDPITLSGNIPSAVFNPKVTSEGRNVYVVWQGDSDSGNQDILMRKSENYGRSFGDVINLSNDRAGSGNPEINVNSSSVYVVWDGTTPGNNDVYFRKSVNNGSDFDKVRNLSTNTGISYEPKVVLGKKGVEIYWRDYRNGHEDVLAKRSLNEGRTFEALKNIDKDVLDLWKDRGGGRDRLSN